MSLTVNTTSNSNSKLMENIHLAFSPTIDIYGQANLKRTGSIQLFKNLESDSDQKLNILFKLEGELAGHIICSFCLQDKAISQNSMQEFQSLFSESMNILLGRFVTDLEDETGLMSLISAPKIIDNQQFVEQINNFPHAIKLKTEYRLSTLTNQFDCTIYINANKKISSEV